MLQLRFWLVWLCVVGLVAASSEEASSEEDDGDGEKFVIGPVLKDDLYFQLDCGEGAIEVGSSKSGVAVAGCKSLAVVGVEWRWSGAGVSE